MTIECPKCQYNNPNDTAFCGKCGTNFNIDKGPTKTLETHSEELTTGSTFAGRYQIIEELGKGGMGRVYKVLDKETNEKIALKLIKPEVATDKKTIERFRNELTTARKIAQKNVCRMFDLNREKDNYFITMEYVPGGDLKKFIRRSKQLTIGTAISIAKQICDGLAEAHNLGVVHRDLKPNNIMIDDNGNARIMDFGIARSVKSKSLTGSGVMIGTPEYMSPEQVEGKEVDQRTDIYALGIILYEMLTGRRPFEGDSPITIGVKHKSEQPENPHKYNPQITDNLSFLILKCLEKSKENRFQFVEEITSELNKLESALPIADKLIPKKSITSKEITVSLPSKRTIIPIAIAVTVLILAVLIFNPFSKKKTVMPSSNKPSIAVLYFENTNDDENLKGYRTMLSNMMITDLSQSKYLNILTIDKTYSLLRKLGIEESKRYSTEDLIKVSREGQVDYVVTGSYIQGIEDFTITLVMQKLDSGKPILNERVSCQGEDDIWPKIDEISKQIKQELISPEQISSDIDRNLKAITTSSTEAYKVYSEGRKRHKSGDYQNAILLLKRAVDIDPDFAMAYRGLSASYNNLYLYQEALENKKKAFDLSDRLSDREKYYIQGEYYLELESYDNARNSLEKLLQLYPEDMLGNHTLSQVYNQIGQKEKAIEHMKAAVRIEPNVPSCSTLSTQYAQRGQYKEALKVLEEYLEKVSDNAILRRSIASIYCIQHDFKRALEELDKAFSVDPSDFMIPFDRGAVFIFQEEFDKAEKEFKRLISQSDPVALFMGNVGLSALDLHQGKINDAFEYAKICIDLARKYGQREWEFNTRSNLISYYTASNKHDLAEKELEILNTMVAEEEKSSWSMKALFEKGLFQVAKNTLDEAQITAEELKEKIETSQDKYEMRQYYTLLGRIEHFKNNYAKAIEFYEKMKPIFSAEFSSLQSRIQYDDFTAEAYYMDGQLEEAQEIYERINNLTLGRLYWGGLHTKSVYMLGKIFEQQGDTPKAIEHYEKILSLWKDADPWITEVDDARKRLTELKND